MALAPGDRFGRYEIAELLGKGGMGEVYRAKDTLLHRRVALKVLHAPGGAADGRASGGSNQTDGAARILREARAAAGIEHPNAISIYDVGEVDGVPFLAMEFVAGKTLRQLAGAESVPLERRIRWLVDAARALGAAHALGLVHRDIKPENVMVRDDGVVKVLDFGIARRTASRVDPSGPTETPALGTLTAEGIVVGTPFYMAPEQMRGEALDGRTDQFAWGVVAYELLTGSLPWERTADGLQLVAQILSREIEPPRARNPQIPAAVDSAIRMALSKSASGRFREMEEVAVAIEPHASAGGAATGRSGARPAARTDTASLAPTEALPSVPSTRTQLATPSPGTSGVARLAGKRAWTRGLAAGLGLLVAGFALVRFAPRGDVAVPRDAGAGDVSESRLSANAEATAAYKAGVQSLRDGSVQLATEQFDRAIELDPRFAVAALHRAQLGGEPQVVKAMQIARAARVDLGAEDRLLLNAMEPLVQAQPDLKEVEARLRAYMKSYPKNVDFPFELGWTLDRGGASAEALAAFEGVLVIDPTFAAAWRMKARELVARDDVDGAMSAYGECLKVSPGAMSCLDDLATLEANQGKCDDMRGTVRRLIALAPEEPESYGRLAQALFSAGEPLDAVRAALTQKWERSPPGRRSQVELSDEAQLALLTGQFAAADAADRTLEHDAASSNSELAHYLPAYDRALIDLELGRYDEVTKIANGYFQRRSAWQADPLATDPTISMYAAELAAGGLAAPGFRELRDAWLAREKVRIAQAGLVAPTGSEWVLGYAAAARTREDALEALASRPDVRPLIDALAESPHFDEPLGRAYLIAGRVEEAIPPLTRASESCGVLSGWAPFFSTWAAFDLGEAKEARGDGAGACTAYRRVLDRWGAAKPPSRTAGRARERARALGCPL